MNLKALYSFDENFEEHIYQVFISNDLWIGTSVSDEENNKDREGLINMEFDDGFSDLDANTKLTALTMLYSLIAENMPSNIDADNSGIFFHVAGWENEAGELINGLKKNGFLLCEDDLHLSEDIYYFANNFSEIFDNFKTKDP